MTSLPVAKAGVGSAVNDTAREVGGALGIAVLGSLLASGYRTNLEQAALDLTAPSATIAEQSVGAALEEAARLGDAGAALAEAARSAYVDAMSTSLFVAAAVLLATIALVMRYVPHRRGPAEAAAIVSSVEGDEDAPQVVAA